MTMPISSDSSRGHASFRDDDETANLGGGCDPNRPSAPAESRSARPEPTISLDPVYVEGDSPEDNGTEALVTQYYRSAPPSDCSEQGKAALLSCGKAVATAAGALVLSPIPLANVAGVAKTFFEGVSCGQDLAALYDCETR